nr:immunoglobulin light chain junction region [Macaca mulatta]
CGTWDNSMSGHWMF